MEALKALDPSLAPIARIVSGQQPQESLDDCSRSALIKLSKRAQDLPSDRTNQIAGHSVGLPAPNHLYPQRCEGQPGSQGADEDCWQGDQAGMLQGDNVRNGFGGLRSIKLQLHHSWTGSSWFSRSVSSQTFGV